MGNSQRGITELLFDSRYRIIWHVLFWSVAYMDWILSFFGITGQYLSPWYPFFGMLIDMVIVYFNLYVLIPRFLMKQRLIIYSLLTLLSLMLVVIYNHYTFHSDPAYYEGLTPEEIRIFFIEDSISSIIHNLFLVGMAVAIKLFKKVFTERVRIQEISNEKLKTELGFLRNQVNPHFLFNTMNSFYIQAKKNDSNLPEAILSFSDLLKHQIYETQKEFVSIKDEFEYIKNYLDLENNRRDNLQITLKDSGLSPHIKIAPLLLLPLVENAVKYSQRTDGLRAIININLEVEEDRIYFTVSNTKGKVEEIRSPDSGIGLENLRRRLELIYPEDHQFAFKDESNIYTASLILGKR